ncbi:MAG: hypothetical protein F6K10_24530 [Moorea sp. SIO2B7]|nr:hypothetical protein [Moorena sp. SIO2B7]
MLQQGLKEFLDELESHCSGAAIATFLDSDGQSFAIDLNREGNRVTYGYERNAKNLFMAKLIEGCVPHGSMVLRSFISEIDQLTQLPIKELRGYFLTNENNTLEFEKIPPNTMFACQNTDAFTGEPLSLEQSVRYC